MTQNEVKVGYVHSSIACLKKFATKLSCTCPLFQVLPQSQPLATKVLSLPGQTAVKHNYILQQAACSHITRILL